MRKASAAASQPATTPIPNGAIQRNTTATISPLAPTMTVRRIAGACQPSHRSLRVGVFSRCHAGLWPLQASKAKAWLISSAARSRLHPLAPWQLRCPQVQPTMVAAIHPHLQPPVGGAVWCARESRNERVRRHCCCREAAGPGKGVVVDEHNVDPAVIVGIGVHNGIVRMRRQCCVQPSTSRSTTNRFPTTRTPSKSRPWPGSWPRSPRRAGRSCDHSDNQDHLIDPAHHVEPMRYRPRCPRSSRSCLLCSRVIRARRRRSMTPKTQASRSSPGDDLEST
jgi:hypothetical protein